MRRRLAPVLLSALWILGAPGCGGENVRIVLVGDSITAGRLSGEGGRGFADQLSDLLGPGFEVVKLGCGGASTRDWSDHPATRQRCLGRKGLYLYEDLARPALPADVAVVLLGTNDALGYYERGQRPRGVAYRNRILQITRSLLEDGARSVVTMAPPPLCVDPRQAAEKFVELYQKEIRRICKTTRGLSCGPDLGRLLDLEADFVECDIHPNASGHTKIAKALAQAILHPPTCANGFDDDGDGAVDYGADRGCQTTMDGSEAE